MPYITIDDIVMFSANNGVMLRREAESVSAEELYSAVQLAFAHMDDPELRNACCGGIGKLADFVELTFDQYIQIRNEMRIVEAGYIAKKDHTKIRRVHYNSRRSELILAMLEAGVPYQCAKENCGAHSDLTIDHIIPLSRGGSDDLKNLQFLCLSHNCEKGDRVEVSH